MKLFTFRSEKLKARATFCFIAAVTVSLTIYASVIRPPNNFPTGAIITIPEGVSISAAGTVLKEQHVIYAPIMFRVFVMLLGDGVGVRAGSYVFAHPLSVFGIASRITQGVYGISPMRITIPEGSSTREIANILSIAFPGFDSVRFRTLASKEEGYLFPDTYFFLPNVSPETVISVMRDNFDTHIQTIQLQITASGRTVSDLIVMASILEKEARKTDTRRTIAGILWHRIAINMPLQVDAVFGYIYDRNTFHPSGDVLDANSPYNTYTHRGLPPGPIDNPGLDSIIAAATPIKTPYLYYLTDKNGIMRYATTFEQHKQNKALYLN